MKSLQDADCSIEVREKLLLASTIAGMVISEIGASLPPTMGYALTYDKGLPHSAANAVLYPGYLKYFKKPGKMNKMLNLIDVESIDALSEIFRAILDFKVELTENEIVKYVKGILSNEKKLENHPERVTRDDLIFIYKNILKK